MKNKTHKYNIAYYVMFIQLVRCQRATDDRMDGQIELQKQLVGFQNLLECLPGLERLELVDLQLDGNDGNQRIRVEIDRARIRTKIPD